MRLRRRTSMMIRRSTMRMMRSSRATRRMMTMKKRRSPVRNPRRRENDCLKISFYSYTPTSTKSITLHIFF
jgi:hypothetical protein